MWASLWIIEEKIGWSAEVLLPMCVIASRPVVDSRVADWAEGSLVAIKHELVVGEHPL